MSVLVTINSITSGTAPYDIWVCDDCSTGAICQYIATTSTVPYSFTLPTVFETYPSYVIKLIDDNGCIYCNEQCYYKQFEDGDCFEFMTNEPYEFE